MNKRFNSKSLAKLSPNEYMDDSRVSQNNDSRPKTPLKSPQKPVKTSDSTNFCHKTISKKLLDLLFKNQFFNFFLFSIEEK